MTAMRVTLLAGGVGGAKMAEGFAALSDVKLSVIGNVADDAEFHGLWVSPDIDTLTYTLAGLVNRDQGWGLADEGHRALTMLERLGEDTWMFLGDRDFGLHIHRSRRLAAGARRSVIAADVARALGVGAGIVLPTDDVVQTKVRTEDGWRDFQTYFVRERCAPEVFEIVFDGIDAARPTPEALAAIAEADLLVIAPSNPLVSIAPILGIPGLRKALAAARAPVVAVSPLIGGKVVKGPADRMMAAQGLRCDSVGVAALYADLVDVMVIDTVDAGLAPEITGMGIEVAVTQTLMQTVESKVRLARQVLGLVAAERRAAAS